MILRFLLALLLATASASAANFPYIRLNAQTNRVSDNAVSPTFNNVALTLQTDFDGTYFKTNALPISLVGALTNWAKLSTNAAGLSPFTNSAGVVQYAPGQAATNVLNIVSGLADNATNAVMIVDTANAWSLGDLEKLQAWRNNGTNVAYLTEWGALEIGKSVDGVWFPNKDDLFVGVHDSSKGESSVGNIVAYATDGGTSSASIESYVDSTTSDPYSQLSLKSYFGAVHCQLTLSPDAVNGTVISLFHTGGTQLDTNPMKMDFESDAQPAYKFGTSMPFTNNLVNVSNAGTNKFSIHYDGSATMTGTLTAPEVDASELYTGSFKLYRGALTPIDAGIALDFGSTNRYWSLSLTGAVTFADAINLTAGKHANVMITGVATNAAYVFPATWIFIGYKPTYLTANKHADIYLKSTSAANSGVWAYYGEEQ